MATTSEIVTKAPTPGSSAEQTGNRAGTTEIVVNNVVCSFSTRCHLNLRKIATQGIHVEYKKENAIVNMRLRKPYTTATVWSSGKITCVGAKSEDDAYKAARRYCRLLQKMQFKVKLCNYRVVNVLATCAIPFALDIARLANEYQKECSYEPELHPGATYRLKELKTTLKIFATGSITLTAPSVQVARQAVNQMFPLLEKFKHASCSVDPLEQQHHQAVTTNNGGVQTTSTIKSTTNHTNTSQYSTSDHLLNNTTNGNGTISKSNSDVGSLYSSNPTTVLASSSSSLSSSVPIVGATTATLPTTNDSYFNSYHNNHHLHNHNHLYHHTNDLLTSPSSFEHHDFYSSNASAHHHHHHHHLQTNFYHQHTSTSHQLFSTSSSLPASTTSASSSQPNNWFYDNLIIEPVDDFLP